MSTTKEDKTPAAVSKVNEYNPKPDRYVRIKLGRKISPQEADRFLNAVRHDACLVQREGNTTVLALKQRKDAVLQIAKEMGVA